VKYENVYLKKYGTMQELLLGLTDYFQFYNQARFHQSLGYATPEHVYASASGGGAKIVDKFGGEKKAPAIEIKKLGQRHSAAVENALS
jgi:putative transposase